MSGLSSGERPKGLRERRVPRMRWAVDGSLETEY